MVLLIVAMTDPAASHEQHASAELAARPIRCAVLTVSDTRTLETDEGGALIERLLREAGHQPAERTIVPDEADAVRAVLQKWIARDQVEVILSTGGTGIAPRDRTVDVVRSMLAAELEGFGELFRMLSWQEVGSAAMLSRAVAGYALPPASGAASRGDHPPAGGTFIFAMPGSPNAVEVAMARLILPQLPHLLWERGRH